ncbi:MAG: TIR domain-containing protein [Hyphomonadaceae bacterium]
MADVFLSYKSQDRPRVALLVRALQERGLTVWWDQRLETGDVWLACIKRALDAAKSVVATWTPQSVGPDRLLISHIMQAEVAEAFRSPKRLVAVRLEAGPLPFVYDEFQAADLTAWTGEAEAPAVDRLVATICEIVGPRQPFAPDELRAWLEAEEQNRPQAFRDFATSFPDSRFSEDAERRAAELAQATADLALARAAAREIIQRFERQADVPAFAPALGLEKVEKERKAVAVVDLLGMIESGARIQLQAEPGAGKTVALLAWARELACDAERPVGIYVRLQEMTGDDELLEHIGKTYATGAMRLDGWEALLRSGAVAVFCDGWNELSAPRRESIGARLDNHARLFPDAGLVIGSRPASPAPLTTPHTVVTLQRLTLADVRAIVEQRLGDKAPTALAELRTDRTLQQLVRNPFFLHAFCVTRTAGATPTTRYGLVKVMVETGERLPQHMPRLRSELADQQSKFMRALAVDVLSKQHELSTDEALHVVNGVSIQLLADRLLAPSPKGRDVLDVLRDHHCLVEHAGPPTSYGFQHQLIEEWYAAEEVLAVADAALTDEAALAYLTRDILNEPQWSEALLFAVESAAPDATAERACAHLILRMIGIDCQFAARLIAAAPEVVWKQIAPAVMAFVEAWKPVAEQELVRFAVVCGKEEFAPLVWEAIAAQKPGGASNALRVQRIRHPAVLGPDWRDRIRDLNVEDRRSILYMLASNSGLEAANMATDAAIEDESAEVQISTAEMLHFYRYDDELDRLLTAALPATWEGLVQRRIDDFWDGRWRTQIVAGARRLLTRLEPGPRRLNVGLLLLRHGETIEFDLVQEVLAAKFEYHFAQDSAFDEIMALEGARLSQAIVDRAVAGQSVPYLARRYVRNDARADQEQLIAACRLKSNSHGNDEVLAPLLSIESISRLFSELLDLARRLDSAPKTERQALSDSYHAIQQSLALTDTDRLVEALLSVESANSRDIRVICDVIARAFRADSRHERPAPKSDLRDRLVTRLAEWADALIADANADRHILSALAEAIGAVPHSSLLAPLHRLLSEDLRRWALEKEAFATAVAAGQRPDPSSGARMSYAFRYAENLLSLAKQEDAEGKVTEAPPISEEMTVAVVDLLCALLTDTQFGADASRALATLFPDPLSKVGERRPSFGDDLSVLPERRRLRAQIGAGETSLVAARMLDAVRSLIDNKSEVTTKLALQVALQAARMACGARFSEVEQLVNEHGTLENKIGMYMSRLFAGHEVSATVAERCLDELDARREKQRWEYDQTWMKWENALRIMVFGGKPMAAAQRLLTYDPRHQQHDERDLVKGLGLCAHADALPALQLLRERCEQLRMTEAWCSAVYNVGTLEAGQALLSYGLTPERRRGWRHDQISGMVASLAARHPALRRDLIATLTNGTDAEIALIADIVSSFKESEIVLEFLALAPALVKRLERALQGTLYDICFEHVPSEDHPGAYDVVAVPVDPLRARLFAGAQDDGPARETYARLLRHIDVLRAEYGRSYAESRHPEISRDAPWPEAASVAWQAAADLRARQ